MPTGEYTHVATEETLQRIAGSLESIANQKKLVWDDENGYYSNQSIKEMLDSYCTGLAFGVSIPKGSSTACTKFGANAGMAAPTPGYVGTPAIDPYTMLGPFVHFDVNGYVEADGTPHVTAIDGDGNFKRDGSNGDVWTLTPNLWIRVNEGGANAVTVSVSDSKIPGLDPWPQDKLPNGTKRPYLLFANYIGVKGEDNLMHSYSGYKPWNRSISHNELITATNTASTGYSGKNTADDLYVKVMFLLKYATKDSQSVFKGCTDYNLQYAPAVAETGVTRVILTNAQAANLVVGSAMMLGTHAGDNPGNDRNTGVNYNVFDGLRILSITDYDTDHKAVNFDTSTTFDTDTTYLLSTSPWFSGCLDDVEGDGTITSAGRTSGKEPFKLQGIECSVGLYEVLGNVILNSDGSTGWEPCLCLDSKNEATSVTANYTHIGKYLPSDTTDGWKYPLYPTFANGLMFGNNAGGSQSTGLCDGEYCLKTATSGTREWLGVGLLNYGANAGLWCLGGNYALGGAHWIIGSRLSALGRGRAAA